MFRILLKHPYQRQPPFAEKALLTQASNITIADVYDVAPAVKKQMSGTEQKLRLRLFALTPEELTDALYRKEMMYYLGGEFEQAAALVPEAACPLTPRAIRGAVKVNWSMAPFL